MGHRLRPVLLLALLCLAPHLRAGDAGLTVDRALPAPTSDRDRLARHIVVHDFENRHDPDSGLPLPRSADLNLDSWPDFWEPIRGVDYPEYLISTVAIVPDNSGQLPGAYRDRANRVLRIGFDGTRVGVRTRVPIPIDPGLAYELSLRSVDTGLEGARIRAGIDWLRIDPRTAMVLRSDDIPDIPTGQIDWPAAPWRMLVSDPPAEANAARLYIVLERLPGAVGGAYRGEARFDDVRLRAQPRIVVDAPRPAADGRGRIIPIRYAGLFDNIPDPANPDYFRGKRYSRRIEVTDVFNRPVELGHGGYGGVDAGEDGMAAEEIAFPPERYGVYYFNLRLYGADQGLAADLVRAVAVMRPAPAAGDALVRAGNPAFGARGGSVPRRILEKPGLLRDMLAGMGARRIKLVPWPGSGPEADDATYHGLLADEARLLRSSGMAVTAAIRPPPRLFGDAGLAQALDENPAGLAQALAEAGRRVGLFMDSWQWGGDDDGGMEGFPDTPAVEQLAAALAQFAEGAPVAWNRVLAGERGGAFPRRPAVINAFFPSGQPSDRLWPRAAPVFPWLFEPFYRERGRIYPPARLSRLAPAPAADAVEERARAETRAGSWLSLDLAAAHPHEANAAAERLQLEEFLVRAVYAAALGPDAIFMGDLFDPAAGFLRRAGDGVDSLETAARPAFLAAGTVSRLLEGAEYLGMLELLQPFEAHVFKRPGIDQTVIALWRAGASEARPLGRREIAEGPQLRLVDWAGNAGPLPDPVPVGNVPAFITGLPASLALTRMSVRIDPNMPVMSASVRQNQALEVVNHLPRQAPVLFRLRYAARPGDGVMENAWAVNPEELRINLPPAAPEFTPGRLAFAVTPDPNSILQKAAPAAVDKSGAKIARVAMTITGSPPADMLLHLPFRLRSEIDVDIEPIWRADDPHFLTLLLKVRWTPADAAARRNAIKLTPFFVKYGQARESAPFPTTVKATPPDSAGFESIELRIPRSPRARTLVGLDEDGGGLFHLTDVTELLQAPRPGGNLSHD